MKNDIDYDTLNNMMECLFNTKMSREDFNTINKVLENASDINIFNNINSNDSKPQDRPPHNVDNHYDDFDINEYKHRKMDKIDFYFITKNLTEAEKSILKMKDIINIYRNSKDEVLNACEKIYQAETNKVLAQLKEQHPKLYVLADKTEALKELLLNKKKVTFEEVKYAGYLTYDDGTFNFYSTKEKIKNKVDINSVFSSHWYKLD